MMENKPMHPFIRLALPAALLFLAGCATSPSTGPKPETAAASTATVDPGQIALRATRRWEHLIAREAEKAWDYLSPGYRETHPRDTYAAAMNNRPVQWYKVEVEEPAEGEPPALECAQPRACTIKLKVHFKVRSHVPGLGTLDSWNVLKEHWVNVRGQWYLVPEDVVR